jgi:hypothetical protein
MELICRRYAKNKKCCYEDKCIFLHINPSLVKEMYKAKEINRRMYAGICLYDIFGGCCENPDCFRIHISDDARVKNITATFHDKYPGFEQDIYPVEQENTQLENKNTSCNKKEAMDFLDSIDHKSQNEKLSYENVMLKQKVENLENCKLLYDEQVEMNDILMKELAYYKNKFVHLQKIFSSDQTTCNRPCKKRKISLKLKSKK